MADIPHFDLPFRFVGGKAVEVEQDSVDDIAVCVEALLRTRPGERIELPTYGIPDPVFVGADTEAIMASVRDWEPRASIAIEEGWDYDAFIQSLRITLSEGRTVG